MFLISISFLPGKYSLQPSSVRRIHCTFPLVFWIASSKKSPKVSVTQLAQWESNGQAWAGVLVSSNLEPGWQTKASGHKEHPEILIQNFSWPETLKGQVSFIGVSASIGELIWHVYYTNINFFVFTENSWLEDGSQETRNPLSPN